ncbi:MAG TPA: hypothetical protein VF885_08125 [Arthrobacter sp.]
MAGLKVKDEYAGLTEAVSLSIAVLKKCRSNTWAELLGAMGAGDAFTVKTLKALDLSAAQLAVIDRFSPVIDMVTIKPSTVPAICPACGLYILTADTAPSRCLITAGCTGKPFKVVAATAGPSPEAEDMLPAADATEQASAGPAGAVASPADDDWDLEAETAVLGLRTELATRELENYVAAKSEKADPVANWVPQLDGPEDPEDALDAEPELVVTASDLEGFDDFEDFADDAPQPKGPRPVIDLDEDPFA